MKHITSIRLNILLTVLLLLSSLVIFNLKNTIDDQQEVIHGMVKTEIDLENMLDKTRDEFQDWQLSTLDMCKDLK